MFSVHTGSHKFSRRFASVHKIICAGSHGSHTYFFWFTLTENLRRTGQIFFFACRTLKSEHCYWPGGTSLVGGLGERGKWRQLAVRFFSRRWTHQMGRPSAQWRSAPVNSCSAPLRCEGLRGPAPLLLPRHLARGLHLVNTFITEGRKIFEANKFHIGKIRWVFLKSPRKIWWIFLQAHKDIHKKQRKWLQIFFFGRTNFALKKI